MTSLLFLLIATAMAFAWKGYRRAGITVFALGALLSVLWFKHHVADPLNLEF
jgi:Family of unknown function (DUF5993)